VVHWEIQSNQPERLQQFYANLFDWHVNANNPVNYGLVETQAGSGIGGGIGGTNGGPNRVTFYVEVPDLQPFLDKAQRLGAKVVMPPTEIPGMVTFALFSDPEGNVLGLVKSSA
jgi:predicted enzyme related to lactoylglutathione lyase